MKKDITNKMYSKKSFKVDLTTVYSTAPVSPSKLDTKKFEKNSFRDTLFT